MSRAADVARSLRAYAVLDPVEFHHAGHLASFSFDAESGLRVCQTASLVLAEQILAFRFPWHVPGYLPLSDAAADLQLSEVTAVWRALSARCDVANAAELIALRRAAVVRACRVGDLTKSL